MTMLMAINMVRKGVKKAYGGVIANVLVTKYGTIRAIVLGAVLAIAMQGATAVIVLTSGLVTTGIISLALAVVVAIGADVGSAIVLRILTFDISAFIPVLLAVGGWLHLKSDKTAHKNIGQIVFGVGLIILSLQMLRMAVQPVGDLPLFMDIAYYFERDLLLAFIIGAVLTFAMHSSVASILVLVTLVHTGTLSTVPGIAFILGANLGSGFIAWWMTRNDDPKESELPKIILLLRGFMAVLGIIVFISIEKFAPDTIISYIYSLQEQSLIYTHVLFNFALLLWVPFVPYLTRMNAHYSPTALIAQDGNGILAIAQQGQSIDGATLNGYVCKEIIFMLDTLANSVSQSEEAYRNYNTDIAKIMQNNHQIIMSKVEDLKYFYADMPTDSLSKQQARTIREYISYAVELGKASEIVSGAFMDLAYEKYSHKILFSEKGWQEIKTMYDELRQGTLLMFDVLMGNKGEQTDEIVRQETVMQTNYQKSLHRHLKRLHVGDTITAHSSDLHLKTVSNIYEIHNTILSLPMHISHIEDYKKNAI